jgi:hypothetical protein
MAWEWKSGVTRQYFHNHIHYSLPTRCGVNEGIVVDLGKVLTPTFTRKSSKPTSFEAKEAKLFLPVLSFRKVPKTSYFWRKSSQNSSFLRSKKQKIALG